MFADVRFTVVCALLLLAPQARDTRPAPLTGTASLAGRVVLSSDSQPPVRHARVVVTRSDLLVTRSALTDDDGEFAVGELPPGRYTVTATKAGLLRAAHGAAGPGRPGMAIALAAGQRVADLQLRMARGGVVTGIVTDPAGRPAPAVAVRLLQSRYEGAERVWAPASTAAGSAIDLTDDRGQYRFFGLMPGEYIVGAMPPDDSLVATRTMEGTTVGFVPVFHPGTTRAAEAARVTVRAGQETGGIDVPLQHVRTARIEGQIIARDGIAPRNLRVAIVPEVATPAIAPGPSASSIVSSLRTQTSVDAEGRFAFASVPPGKYTVAGRAVEPVAPKPGVPYVSVIGGITSRWAMTEVIVDGGNVSGVTLTLQPGLTVSGRVELEHAPGASPMPDASRVRVYLYGLSRARGAFGAGSVSGTVSSSGEFVVEGVVPGRYRVSASYANDIANGWSVKSVLLEGRNTLDLPLEVTPDGNVTGLAITMTRATQRVSGLLLDGTGKPAPGLTIVLFPADRALWASTGRIRTARSGQDGRYVVNDLRAGEYRIAALTDVIPGDVNDPAFLETLIAASIPVAIREGERKMQDLRVGESR
jgi:protocatechuate 3,4-dioxygenase beta subunit